VLMDTRRGIKEGRLQKRGEGENLQRGGRRGIRRSDPDSVRVGRRKAEHPPKYRIWIGGRPRNGKNKR